MIDYLKQKTFFHGHTYTGNPLGCVAALASLEIFEKYNVEDVDTFAGGGEYPVQEGFGWTNGVLLTLMNKYHINKEIPAEVDVPEIEDMHEPAD